MEMEKKKPYLAVILIQIIYAGMFLLSKAAFDVGMNTFVFTFYRQAAATFFLAPLAFFIQRKQAPSLSFSTLCKIFGLSFLGITVSLNLYGVALLYTSASLAAATTNSLPVITFFIAILLGAERVSLRTRAGIVKVVGISVCMGGVATLAFYRGPYLKLLMHHHLFQAHHRNYVANSSSESTSRATWTKGVFLLLLSNTFWGLWLVLQGRVMKGYPSKLLFTALQCLLSAIQSFFVAIALERDPCQWKLGWNVRLLAVAYCGIGVTGVTYYLQAWVIEKRGAVFLAMSTPLTLVLTIVFSAFLFGELISFGSVLGAILLVGGLYSVLWGKSKEEMINMDEAQKQNLESKEVILMKSLSAPLPV